MAALLALSGALLWGVGDFLGGFASRRLTVLAVLAVSQAIGLAGLAVWVLFSGEPFPGVVELLPAVAAGVAGLVGLAALYRGFAIGAMGIVAPISAAGPVVPLAVDVARGAIPNAAQWIGIALVTIGVVTLSREASPEGTSRVAAGVGLALLSAAGFGLFFLGLDASTDESVPWAAATVRGTSVVLLAAVVLATSASLRATPSLLLGLAAVGVFDTSANVAVAAASTEGAIGIVAVLSALYPVVTVVLARLVLGERLSPGKRVGGAVALAGAALVAVG